jgi:hypothetical protein
MHLPGDCFILQRSVAGPCAEGDRLLASKSRQKKANRLGLAFQDVVVDGSPLNNFLFALKHAGEC